jgi:aminoglycoside 6'-N-acetyltransferase
MNDQPGPSSADGLPRGGARVRLRRLRADDLSHLAGYRADPVLARYQGWTPMSTEQALALLLQMQAAPAFVAGEWFQLGIADSDSDALLGDIGVRLQADGSAEIGFTLARAAQGRGLATEALSLLVTLLFERADVRRIVGITDARNAASARLLLRLGLSHTRTLQASFRGEACTEWVFERARG